MNIKELRDNVKNILSQHGRQHEKFYVQTMLWNDRKEQEIQVHCYDINRTFNSENPHEIVEQIRASLISKPTETIEL